MSIIQHYQLKLIFNGPLISQATGTIPLGLDAAMQMHNHHPVINGSLIRGNIRHVLTEFATLAEDKKLARYIKRWFGEASSDGEYSPQRTLVDFDFFWELDKHCQQSGLQRTRIAINVDTGTVQENAMQIVADCFPLGSEQPIFLGKITARLQNNNERYDFEKWINKALEYIPAMGSFKGVGWGRLDKHQLEPKPSSPSPIDNNGLAKHATRFGIQLKLDRPLCLGVPRTPDSNQIISSEMIPGNVIKALIARLYDNNATNLEKFVCFDQLIITHATPAKQSNPVRHMPLPLSLATINLQNNGSIAIDLAQIEQHIWPVAPTLALDWKAEDKDLIGKAISQGVKAPNRIVVLRTEINADGVSEQGKLFSLECIDPDAHIWCAEIELCQISPEKRVAVFKALLARLQHGLSGVGKTKAHASISFDYRLPITQKYGPLALGQHIVTLKTAARMLPPNLRSQGTNSAGILQGYYLAYWQTVLEDHDIKLSRYFAQQSLSSCYYHQRQYQAEKTSYHPEWLTNAGSVFILDINNANSLARLQGFIQTGLPAHTEIDGTVATWQSTPYLPENGYGEIMLDYLPLHQMEVTA